MPKFLAITSKGLNQALESELKELGFHSVQRDGALGVSFEGSWAELYRAHLYVKCASRILLPILDFYAYSQEELYSQVQKHDYTKYISVDQTLKVEVSLKASAKWKDGRFVAMKVKDAVVDQFVEKFGARPDVSKEDFDLRLKVHSFKNHFSISVDLTGNPSLGHRGYRKEAGLAPVREPLAAAILRYMEWTPEVPLVDLMCGSGTFLIEASLRDAPCGLLRKKKFAFQKFKTFQQEAWVQSVDKAVEDEARLAQVPMGLYGFDKCSRAVKNSKVNAGEALFEDRIQFERCQVNTVKNPIPDQTGMLIINPPYGERLDPFDLEQIYRDLGYTLKHEFPNWTCWILSYNPELVRFLQLKSDLKIPLWNGNLECRLMRYRLNKR